MNASRRRRHFAWRPPLLDALRVNPNMSRACTIAAISRNSAYVHIRKDPAFRRQVDRAIDAGREASYRAHQKLLQADPSFQRAMHRAQAAIAYWARRPGVTDCLN